MIIIVIIIVFAGLYLHTVSETKLVVDTSRGETLRIKVIIVLFLKLIYLLFSLGKKGKTIYAFAGFASSTGSTIV